VTVTVFEIPTPPSNAKQEQHEEVQDTIEYFETT
jgi:hypothetical protein